MKKLLIASLVILLATALFINGCGQTGTLMLFITDVPSNLNIEKLDVTLSKIEVHQAQSETEDPNMTTDSWITVLEEERTYDLIDIENQKRDLSSKDLGIGKYTQIRVTVSKATATIDGTTYNLTIPSEAIKLIKPFNIELGKTTELTLDFNAQDSVHKDGENKYIMNPVIKVLSELSDETCSYNGTDMTYLDALSIAQNSSCVTNETALVDTEYVCDTTTGKWAIDVSATNPPCESSGPVCLVNIQTREAVLTWNCGV